MRAVIQSVNRASVHVVEETLKPAELISEIGPGIVTLLGVSRSLDVPTFAGRFQNHMRVSIEFD